MQLTDVKGIKEKRLFELNENGIFTTADLLNFLPVKYLDMTRLISPCDFFDGAEALIKATATSEAQNLFYSRVKTTKISLECEGTKLSAMWFNQPYMKNNLKSGETYVFYGKLKIKDKRITLLSPMFEREDKQSRLFGIFPKYRKIEGVPSTLIERAVEEILTGDELSSIIPDGFYPLTLKDGYRLAHFPSSIEEASVGNKRILMERMTANFLANMAVSNGNDGKNTRYKGVEVERVLQDLLPFSLYKSQIKAIGEVIADMKKTKPMNRLLQGDVGSGKTVVILAGCLLSALSGYQSAVMCPTATLAKQHYNFFKSVLDKIGVSCALLTAESSKDESVLNGLKNGEIAVVIGTHALFSKKVEYKKLAFVGIDEQQKFGVSARADIMAKGENVDVLTSTATPIPRTLSLITYGELNVSYCERESRRSDVQTLIITEKKTKELYRFIEKELENGGAAYVVCRKIDTTEQSEEEGAIEKYKELKKAFSGYNVGLLHGRMGVEERKKATEKFLNGEIDLLVSTSVIEVGVDSKRASVIAIFGAENFGLSSLHQLRGRVGRQGQKAYCVLVCDAHSEKARERLEFFKNNDDGFKIADYDLETRGGGDVYGFNQHGKSYFNVGEFISYEDVKEAKALAEKILQSGLSESVIDTLGKDRGLTKKIALN